VLNTEGGPEEAERSRLIKSLYSSTPQDGPAAPIHLRGYRSRKTSCDLEAHEPIG
jgi:hypothetical protein